MDANPLQTLLNEAAAAVAHEVVHRRRNAPDPVWPTDREVAELDVLLAGTTHVGRDEFRSGLTDRQCTFLGRYGFRCAALALRERSPQRLRIGLIACALADTNDDPRDLMVGVAVHHHVARKLGLIPAEIFDEAASYASQDTADVLRVFGRRTDVTLKAFGWQADTPDGPDIVAEKWTR